MRQVVVARTDGRSDRIGEARSRPRLHVLIVMGFVIWLMGPLLVAAVVDGYVDGRKFREGHASTTATVTGGSPNSGGSRTRQIEFQAGGERQTAYVLLPNSLPVGAQVQIEYAVDDPFVANVAGERPQVHGRWGWVDIGVALLAAVSAMTWHINGVRRYRRKP